MANSNNKQSRGLISNAFGVAKKLTNTGFDLLTHVAPGSVSKLNQTPDDHQVIQGTVKDKAMTEQKKYENPQQMIREHFPKVTQQLLGRHYSKVNNVTSFISPDLNNKIADYFFDKLDGFASDISSVDHVLKEVGAKSLDELSTNPSRSSRISSALANQNKILAAVQGVITGATGVVGTAVDIPTSLALTLRAIYQTGRAHGFELNRSSEQEIVGYVFRQVDLGTIAEKQTVLVALRALSNLLETQDTQQLQRMLGSSNDFAAVQKWLSNDDGTMKWGWLNHIPKISILSKLTPLAGAGIGAVYSWKLIEDANQKAQVIFSSAQQYLIQHPNESVDILNAYEKSQALMAQASPILLKDAEAKPARAQHDLDSVASENKFITEVHVEKKGEQKKADETPVVDSVEQGIKKLAEEYVEPQVDVKEESSATTNNSVKNDASKSDSVKQDADTKDETKNQKKSEDQPSEVKVGADESGAKGEAKVNTVPAKKPTQFNKRAQRKKT